MAKRLLRLSEKQVRRNFLLSNKAGQLGKQGVKGPVELAEKRTLGLVLRKPKGVKNLGRPRGA